MLIPLIILVLSIPIILGMVMFWKLFSDDLEAKKHKRKLTEYKTLYRFEPDQNGNYPAYYHPRTAQYFAPGPGNRAIAENFLLNNGQAKAAVTPDRTLVINTRLRSPGYQEHSDGDSSQPTNIQEANFSEIQEPELLPSPVKLSEMDVHEDVHENQFEPEKAKNVRTLAEIQLLLQIAKQEGRGKLQAITDITGLTARTGSKFKSLIQYWDSLPDLPGPGDQGALPGRATRAGRKGRAQAG